MLIKGHDTAITLELAIRLNICTGIPLGISKIFQECIFLQSLPSHLYHLYHNLILV